MLKTIGIRVHQNWMACICCCFSTFYLEQIYLDLLRCQDHLASYSSENLLTSHRHRILIQMLIFKLYITHQFHSNL